MLYVPNYYKKRIYRYLLKCIILELIDVLFLEEHPRCTVYTVHTPHCIQNK